MHHLRRVVSTDQEELFGAAFASNYELESLPLSASVRRLRFPVKAFKVGLTLLVILVYFLRCEVFEAFERRDRMHVLTSITLEINLAVDQVRVKVVERVRRLPSGTTFLVRARLLDFALQIEMIKRVVKYFDVVVVVVRQRRFIKVGPVRPVISLLNWPKVVDGQRVVRADHVTSPRLSRFPCLLFEVNYLCDIRFLREPRLDFGPARGLSEVAVEGVELRLYVILWCDEQMADIDWVVCDRVVSQKSGEVLVSLVGHNRGVAGVLLLLDQFIVGAVQVASNILVFLQTAIIIR